ncbi:hypothetical protein BDP27DRAFT_647893 [Rhodocollybia butyracea]|uniref:Uncharacterized protein n=1 Tax=Rhodocollybia butyracea TaxID=206335 RepID=A0A9P5PQ88_9AGAR|nr:hypothetical protein BDP27DRAFT_647893 [Rhodocollybia butyracea]
MLPHSTLLVLVLSHLPYLTLPYAHHDSFPIATYNVFLLYFISITVFFFRLDLTYAMRACYFVQIFDSKNISTFTRELGGNSHSGSSVAGTDNHESSGSFPLEISDLNPLFDGLQCSCKIVLVSSFERDLNYASAFHTYSQIGGQKNFFIQEYPHQTVIQFLIWFPELEDYP